MAAIDELIEQIDNPTLRERIAAEVHRVVRQKKFGLVFEEHLPERTLLYEVPIQRGSLVARNGNAKDVYQVIGINGGKAECYSKNDKTQVELPLEELTCVAEFGDPIYPYLEPLDSVENAPDSGLWHTLIEADNYHALQLLDYAYHGKVDCIYIDPPYNTGARDWKYNNDYVDGNDQYRHSKWLSMMKKRLLLAKKLLNPKDSVLIVTIDEKEYLHLGCLLEELFPESRIQMISVAIHASGVARAEFSRTDEYYFYVFLGDSKPTATSLGQEWNADGVKRQKSVRWESLLRSGNNGRRIDRPNLYYPVFFDKDTESFAGVGDAIPLNISASDYKAPDGLVAVLPSASDGAEACWRISSSKLLELHKIGAFDWGEYKAEKTALKYLKPGELKKIEDGEYVVTGKKPNGAMIISSDDYKPKWIPGTQWHVSTHQAGGTGGSGLIKQIFANRRFEFPKSLYAVRDSIKFILSSKPHALVLDFFAGSGTTLHAVNLLNAEDGGNRRCILVTNNEVSDDEAKALSKQGHKPGDDEWNKLGIARYVTWPRTVCSIEGHDINGQPLKGSYLGADRPMSAGFPANANFFKLGFLDKDSVSRGKQLEKLIPVLWMKAGAHGKCPSSETNDKYLIYPENRFAVLIDTKYASEFKQELSDDIRVAYIVTDYEPEYRDIANGLHWKTTYQLYRDYLDNFAINTGRE